MIYRKDIESRGEGVMLAIGNNFTNRLLPSPPNLEVITVSISLVPAVTCCMVYTPPNATAEYHDNLINYFTTITSLPNRIFIIGDFNITCLTYIGLLSLDAQ